MLRCDLQFWQDSRLPWEYQLPRSPIGEVQSNPLSPMPTVAHHRSCLGDRGPNLRKCLVERHGGAGISQGFRNPDAHQFIQNSLFAI